MRLPFARRRTRVVSSGPLAAKTRPSSLRRSAPKGGGGKIAALPASSLRVLRALDRGSSFINLRWTYLLPPESSKYRLPGYTPVSNRPRLGADVRGK